MTSIRYLACDFQKHFNFFASPKLIMEVASFEVGSLSDLSDGEIDKAISDMQPQNTLKQTRWGFEKFQKWLERRPSITVDFKQDSEEHIASILRKFYLEVSLPDI